MIITTPPHQLVKDNNYKFFTITERTKTPECHEPQGIYKKPARVEYVWNKHCKNCNKRKRQK